MDIERVQHVRSAAWRAAASSLVLLMATGCESSSRSMQPRVAAVSLAEQIRAIREGRADAIRAEEPLTDDEWALLGDCRDSREIVLRRGIANDARAGLLASLPKLERLVLRESPLSDDGFAALARCPLLRDLNVPHAECTDAGIRSLVAVPTLRSLRLGSPRLSGAAACTAVRELGGLVTLHLIDVPIGDKGLDILAEMPALRTLYLDGAGVSDEAWTRYVLARPDVHLHIDQVHHDRDPRRGHE